MPKEQIHQEVTLPSGARVDKLLMFGVVRDVKVNVDGTLHVYIGGTEKRLQLPYPFTPVDQRVLSPAEGPILTLDFEPTREEYVSGSVQFPPGLIKRIDDVLEVHREALVIGEGAAGKTVLAYGYGFRHQTKLCSALYLDCRDHLDALPIGQILDVVETWRSPELLLLIDNVHLIPEGFEQLRRALRNLQAARSDTPSPDAFAVLYFGRRIAHHLDESSRTVARMERAGRVVRIKGDRYAFRAVHTRLCLRHNTSPSLPDAIFERWANEFGGDLIAFSVAANSCGPGLGNPKTVISPAQALDSVRKRYLKPLKDDPSAYHNFLILCSLVELELRAPRSVFKTITPLASPFGPMVDEGIVYEERRIKDWITYDLPHPSLGGLILRAEPSSPDRAHLLAEASTRNPLLTIQVLPRLYARALHADAHTIEDLFHDSDFFGKCVASFKAQHWYSLFQKLENGAPDLHRSISKRLTQQPYCDSLLSRALETQIVHLATFLRYAEGSMPEVWTGLKEGLAREEHRARLLSLALGIPLHFLKDFLRYAEQSMPFVATSLKEGLAQEDQERLLNLAFETPLHFIKDFLRYAEKAMPAVAISLKEGLGQEEHRERLLSLALKTPLGDLAAFLQYAQEAMPNVWCALQHGLLQQKHRECLLSLAIQTPPYFLKDFLSYADKAMPHVAVALKESLGRQDVVEALLIRILETPLHLGKDFIIYTERSIPELSTALKKGLAREEHRGRLIACALKTSLHHLKDFVRYAEKAIPLVATSLKEAFAREDHRERLLSLATKTSLGDLTNFLQYAEAAMPDVWTTLEEGLAHGRYCRALLKRALETSLDQLATFLLYVEQDMPQLANALKQHLAQEENHHRLLTTAFDTSLEHVARFLRCTEGITPEAWRGLTKGLAREENRHRLLIQALNTSLEHLLSFLRYAEEAMPDVWMVLKEGLAREEYRQRLLTRAREIPSVQRADFLRYADRAMPEIGEMIRAGLAS